MKKFISKLLLFLAFVVLLICGVGEYALGQTTSIKSYYYESIGVDIQINQDSTFDVSEKQTYRLDGNFGYFYRDIELKNLDHISDIEVFDSQNKKLNKDEYKISSSLNRQNIRWDFPRRIFDNELKSWTIKYKVYGGLGFFESWDELYWNAVFSDRDVKVKQAEVLVHLPKEIDKEKINARLFIGGLGSKKESENWRILDNQTVKFWGSDIEPYSYLTVVATWPKGIVQKPFLYRNQTINWIVLLISLALPIFFLVKMFILWKEKGKDPKIQKTIIAQYAPPENISPAIAAVLIKQDVNVKDIIAIVVDLAVRGYLKIREEEKSILFFKQKEYILEKLKSDGDLNSFEISIIWSIFENKNLVYLDSLRNKFYRKIPGIKKAIHKETGKTGCFSGNIQRVRKNYQKNAGLIILSLPIFLIFFLSVWLGGKFQLLDLWQYFIPFLTIEFSLAISAIIVIIFSYFMPSLTQKGLEEKWKLLGFKEYLQTAERFRIGAETLETFSKYLPYAMVLGVEKKWAKRFSDFAYQEQNWYAPVYVSGGFGGKGGTPMSFNSFSSSFSSFASSISSSFGGGASGAGAGGGAGGGGGGGGGGAG